MINQNDPDFKIALTNAQIAATRRNKKLTDSQILRRAKARYGSKKAGLFLVSIGAKFIGQKLVDLHDTK